MRYRRMIRVGVQWFAPPQRPAHRPLRTPHALGNLSQIAAFLSHLSYHEPVLSVDHRTLIESLHNTRMPQLDREALLAFYDFPTEHWMHIRTTNPIESTFAEKRWRRIQGGFHGDAAWGFSALHYE